MGRVRSVIGDNLTIKYTTVCASVSIEGDTHAHWVDYPCSMEQVSLWTGSMTKGKKPSVIKPNLNN